MADVLHGYVGPPGPLALETVAAGNQARVRVKAVAPLPAAISRYAAAALNELRGALEHVLFAEVEHQLGRPLSDAEGRLIEMPAAARPGAFEDWTGHRRRLQLRPLRPGTPLIARIRGLQPFESDDADGHPLRLLVDYTNHAKHRAPAVAATRIGAVVPDVSAAGLRVTEWGQFRPIEPGDVLASGPAHVSVPLSIFPVVSLRRPRAGTWHVLMTELGDLANWVRTVAVPRLVAGRDDVDPLPPQLDTTVGHEDLREALRDAGTATAAERFFRRLDAMMAREALPEILALHPDRPDPALLASWAATLTDDQVLERHSWLPVTRHLAELAAVDAAVRRLLAEAQQHHDDTVPRPPAAGPGPQYDRGPERREDG
jgi:hypothetical protein